MDTFLDNLYCDIMDRYWNDSSGKREALAEWDAAKGKDWLDLCDAAQLLAEKQSFAAFLAAFHLGAALERTLWQQSDAVF